jgi:3-hydroxyisobutyrate dehydrogenase-like beta-hydroxyacid dehydrogenase
MSTISPTAVERLERAHAAAGQVLVSAPVFGRPDAAAAAKLFVVAAGEERALERVRPALDAMGQRVFVLGTRPAHASLAKLAGNFMITAAIEALAEAMALVAKGGVDRERFLEVLTESLFSAPAYKTYGRKLLDESFSPPGFTLPLGAKDNRLFIQAGERLDVPLPLASLVHDRIVTALARGYGALDWSVFGRIASEEAGVAQGVPAGASGAGR